jgi:hypothetical protein
MSDSRLDEIAAVVMALRSAVYALIATHPDHAHLLEAFQVHRKTFEELSVASTATDAQLKRAAKHCDDVEKAIRAYSPSPLE